ncbi:fibronectin type III domain-containing protein [Photobacterium sanguinicancri]|uniref:Fibronectin type-III domain-containing protein n=1 Tax=Photobacterium sanguinicancri TaxID=875932 RepID=A0AAW7Y3B7_9GAMM|nr:hypothetical protein [Photobacterium sanguinicancri]MDO6541919.1 hypothetical protein [Photobacterium sanguinicancri]
MQNTKKDIFNTALLVMTCFIALLFFRTVEAAVIEVAGSDIVYDTDGDDHIIPSLNMSDGSRVYLRDGNDLLEFDEGDQVVDIYEIKSGKYKKEIYLGAGNDTFTQVSGGNKHIDFLHLDLGEGKDSLTLQDVREFTVNKERGGTELSSLWFSHMNPFEKGVVNAKDSKLVFGILDGGAKVEMDLTVNIFGNSHIQWYNYDFKKEFINAKINFLAGSNSINVMDYNDKSLNVSLGQNSEVTRININGVLYSRDDAVNDLPITVKFPPGVQSQDIKINYKDSTISMISNGGPVLELGLRFFSYHSYSADKTLKMVFVFDDKVMTFDQVVELSKKKIEHLQGDANINIGHYPGEIQTGSGNDRVIGGCDISTGQGNDIIDLSKVDYYSRVCSINPGSGFDELRISSELLYNINYISGTLNIVHNHKRGNNLGVKAITINNEFELSKTKFEIINDADLKVVFSENDEVNISDFFVGNIGLNMLSEIIFSNGESMSSQALYNMFNRPEGDYKHTDNDDVISAVAQTNSILHGGLGNDKLSGGIEMYGDEGDDVLRASDYRVNTLLSGGKGKDELHGTYYSSNTYLFNINDGDDVILGGCQGRCGDTIKFGADIALNDLYFSYVINKENKVVAHVAYPGGSILIDPSVVVDKVVLNNGDVFSFYKLFPDSVVLSDSEQGNSFYDLGDLFSKVSIHGNGGDDVLKSGYYSNGGEGDDNIDGSTISEGGVGADSIYLSKSDNQVVYNLNDTCGINRARCGSDESIYGRFSKDDAIININFKFGAGVTLESLVVHNQNNDVSLGYGADDVIVVAESIASYLFTDKVNYLFENGIKLTGTALYQQLFPTNEQSLTAGDDRYFNYAVNPNHKIMMLAGDDNFLGGGGIVYPSLGNDTITDADQVVIRKGDGVNTIYPKGRNLLLAFPDVTVSDIANELVALTSHSYKSENNKFYHLDIIADFGGNDKTIIKNAVTCKTICEVADVSLVIPGMGTTHIMDVKQTQNLVMFHGLYQQFNYKERPILTDSQTFNFKSLNTKQNYSFMMAADGVNFCTVNVDANYTVANDTSNPLDCMLRVNELASGLHMLTATYQFADKAYQTHIDFIANPQMPIISKFSPALEPAGLKVANYPFSITIEHNQVHASVDVNLNGTVIHEALDSGDGRFSTVLNLPFVEGINDLTFVLKNSIGKDSLIYKIDYKDITTTPTNISATQLNGRMVKVKWSAERDIERYSGYYLYCSLSPFDAISLSNMCSPNGLIKGNETIYAANGSGKHYFRVAAVDKFGNPGSPSEMTSISVDVTPPDLKIQIFDQNKKRVKKLGLGTYTVIAEYDEIVVDAEILNYYNDVDEFNIKMVFDSATNSYIGTFDTHTLLNKYTGMPFIVNVSAKDLAGNYVIPDFRHKLDIDIVGPQATQIDISPKAVEGIIQYTSDTPVIIDWQFEESLAENTLPAFSYNLSGAGRGIIPIKNISSLGNQRYRSEFVLPNDAGAVVPEKLTLYYSAQDMMGNMTENQADPVTYQVSLNDITPPAVPELSSSGTDLHTVLLSWQFDDIGKDLHHFFLYIDENNAVQLDKDLRSYNVTDRLQGETIPIRLTAIDNSGNESTAASQLSSTLIANPIISSIEPGDSQVTLTWSSAMHNGAFSHYAIYADTVPFTTLTDRDPIGLIFDESNRYDVTELNNEQQYYFAVVSVNIAGESLPSLETVSATPESDNAGPDISQIRWDGFAFIAQTTIKQPGVWALDATDDSGISRLEVILDDEPYEVDTVVNDGLSVSFDPASMVEGSHTVRFRVFDIYDNQTEQTFAFNISLDVPETPAIIEPKDHYQTGEKVLAIVASANWADDIQLILNDEPHGHWMSLDEKGLVGLTASLNKGANRLAVKARNRAGESTLSKVINVNYDVNMPASPTRLQALSKPGGEVSLAWSSEDTTIYAGYIVYRSTKAFTNVLDAIRINALPVQQMSYHDLAKQDDQYFYRVTAISASGVESLPSALVEAIADSTGPTASITYRTDGQFDAESKVYGTGKLTVDIEVSEPLLTIPFVSLATASGLHSVELRASSETTYSGEVLLDATWAAGVAKITFSARDMIGNRGFNVIAGDSVALDTQGPNVIKVETLPVGPIKVDNVITEVEVLVTFDEVLNMEPPRLGHQLGSRPAGKSVLTKLDDKTWQTNIQLPSDAGLEAKETLAFSVTAKDKLENPSTWQSDTAQNVDVYQGELPPLYIPLGLRAKAIQNGKVSLQWLPVEKAAGYQLYRQESEDLEPQVIARVDKATEYIDTPPSDGAYRYAVASIRSANGQEAISAPSVMVSVNADSEPPLAPANFHVELTPIGIKLTWDANNNDGDIRYDVYRDATSPITESSQLAPLLADIAITTAIDGQPSQNLPAYAVIARDAAGNRSELSETAYLNISLLPVRDVVINKIHDQYPTLQWGHDSTALAGFKLLAGNAETGLPLTEKLISQNQYRDTGYSQGERLYTLIAEDRHGEHSLPRSVLLPDVDMTFSSESVLKRNLFSKVQVEVTSRSSRTLVNQRLKADLMGQTVLSQPFELHPGTQSIEMIFAGDENLPDRAEFTLSLQGMANVGETVTITQPVALPVEQGQVSVALETRNVIRGGTGEFRYVITNPGDEVMSMLTAANGGQQPSPDIKIRLLDDENNTLSVQKYKQVSGDNIVTVANTDSILNIPPKGDYRSEWVSFNVPASTPYDAILQMDIAHFYAHYGQDTQLQLSGVVAKKALKLVDTPYYGQISAVTPRVSFGDKPIVINGKAIDRESELPTPFASLSLIVSHQGFERRIELMTDKVGSFNYEYRPVNNERGEFDVSVIHPDVNERPNQSTFMIQGATVNPTQVTLRTVKTVAQPFPLTVKTGEGTSLSEIKLVPTIPIPVGIKVLQPSAFSVAESSQQSVEIKVLVASEGPEKGELHFDVSALVEGEDIPRTIGQVQVQFNAAEATPSVFVTPGMLEFGATLTGSDEMNLTIENRGTDALYAVQIELLTSDGQPAPKWLQNRSHSTYPQLPAGEALTLNLGVFPQGQAATGTEEFMVKITSANHAPRHVPVFISLVEDGFGKAQFKVANIYTGTLDIQGKEIQGLEGARISLRNEAAPDVEYHAITDQYGEVFIPEIRAGSYQYWVTKSEHQTSIGRLIVKPGLVANEWTFLDYITVNLDWNVEEIPLQDDYEIVINVDFVTDVPAAVLVAEPAALMVPILTPGEVFYGEIRITNHGLIRAKSVEFVLPATNNYFQYELLVENLPEVIEAKQSVVIPYRITGLSPIVPDGTGSGGGCQTYSQCMQVNAKFDCAGGNESNANTQSCFVQRGSCSTDGNGGGGSIWDGGFGGGGQGDLKPQEATPFPLPMCRVDCPDGCESGNNGGGR